MGDAAEDFDENLEPEFTGANLELVEPQEEPKAAETQRERVQHSVKLAEVSGIKEKKSRGEILTQYKKRHDLEAREKWGFWAEQDKSKKLNEVLEGTHDRLSSQYDIPKGKLVGIDSPEINAYVIKDYPDVFIHSGLLNQLSLWCSKHGKNLTEDKIAFIIAHEMAHLEQGTEEKDGESLSRDRQEIKNHEYDADRTAILRMAKAGYNPREGLEVLSFLQSLGDGIPYFSTHPKSVDRLRELEDLVSDSNRFIVNVEKKPQAISPEIMELFAEPTISHNGTSLYRNEGFQNLEEEMANASNISSAIEIAGVASAHNANIFAHYESQDKEWKELIAKRIFMHNIELAIEALANTYISQNVTMYSVPDNESRYMQREFDFEAKVARPTKDEEALRITHNEEIAKTIMGLKEALATATKEVEDDIDILEKSIVEISERAAGRSTERPYSHDDEQLEGYKTRVAIAKKNLIKLKELGSSDMQLIRESLASVSSGTLESYIKNTEIILKDDQPARRPIPKSILEGPTEEIVSWASQNGSPYFTDKARTDWDKLVDKESSGIANRENDAERYLPEDLTAVEDLRTPEGRADHLLGVTYKKAHYYHNNRGGDILGKMALRLVEEDELMEETEGLNLPTPNIDRVVNPFIDQLEMHYSSMGIAAARRLAEYVGPRTLAVEKHGYQEAELEEIIEHLSIDDCKKIAISFAQSMGEVTASANQQFISEIENGGTFTRCASDISVILLIWEKQIVKMAQTRVEESEDTRDPLAEIKVLTFQAESSHGSQEGLSLILGAVIKNLKHISFSTAKGLHETVGEYLDQLDEDTRKTAIREIRGKTYEKMPPSEWMIFMNGESQSSISRFLKEVWFGDKENKVEKEGLSKEEQLKFLEAFFTVVEEHNKYEISEERALQLSREYILLYLEINPASSLIVPLEFVLRNWMSGYPDNKEAEKVLFGSREIEDRINQLSKDEVIEFSKTLATGGDDEFESKTMGYEKRIRRAVSRSAIAYLNGKSGFKHTEMKEDAEFDTSIPIEKNIANILECSVKNCRQLLLFECLKKYGIIQYTDMPDFSEKVQELVESASENPQAIWPERFITLLEDIHDCGDKQQKYELIPRPDKLEEIAAEYKADAEKTFADTLAKVKPTRYKSKLLEAYFRGTKLIKGVPHQEEQKTQSSTREAIKASEAIETIGTISPLERAKRVVELIPEATDYKDVLFEEIEASVFEEHKLSLKEGKIVAENEEGFSSAARHQLFDFFRYAIANMKDAPRQQFWGRKTEQFFNDYLEPDERTFEAELARTKEMFPNGSFTRDEALENLGNSPLVETPEQAKAISSLLFENQRRSQTDKEKGQQRRLEVINELTALLSRGEKKDLVLWLIGARSEPPLTLKAYGAHNECSVEDIPNYIFGDTSQQREEFFLRLLYGKNGLMSTKNPEDEEIFDELLDRTFDKVFPSDGELGETGLKVLRTIFKTVLTNYPPFRRSKIFIAMIEALMNESEEGTTGKRMCTLLEQLGPVFIKAGQVLSEEKNESGGSLLPEDIADELKNLKKNAKPFHRIGAFEVMESMNCFEGEGDEQIVSLGKQLGSASIKVVYAAKNRGGETKVIKLRRPSIGKHLTEDLRVLGRVVAELEQVDEITLPKGIDRTVERWMREEADFGTEVANHKSVSVTIDEYQKTRSKELLGEMTVKTPKIGVASKEHIIEEYGQGITLEDLLKAKRGKVTLEELVLENFPEVDDQTELISKYNGYLEQIDKLKHLAFDSLMYQTMVAGNFHADMHAGNIILTPNNELVLIDLGSTGEVGAEKAEELREFFHAFLMATQPMLEFLLGEKVHEAGEKIKNSLRGFIVFDENDAGEKAKVERKLEKIEEICKEKRGTKEIIQKILQELTDEDLDIHPGFEKFLKALGTANYLKEGQEMEAFGSIMTHAPFDI